MGEADIAAPCRRPNPMPPPQPSQPSAPDAAASNTKTGMILVLCASPGVAPTALSTVSRHARVHSSRCYGVVGFKYRHVMRGCQARAKVCGNTVVRSQKGSVQRVAKAGSSSSSSSSSSCPCHHGPWLLVAPWCRGTGPHPPRCRCLPWSRAAETCACAAPCMAEVD
jgi:hypothetical protein